MLRYFELIVYICSIVRCVPGHVLGEVLILFDLSFLVSPECVSTKVIVGRVELGFGLFDLFAVWCLFCGLSVSRVGVFRRGFLGAMRKEWSCGAVP